MVELLRNRSRRIDLSDTERPEKVGRLLRSTHPAHRGNRISHKGAGERQGAAAARSRIAANPGLSQDRQVPSIARNGDAFREQMDE